ncbi:transmembrane protein [Thalictrum thalictroides]|uniref:Transmembrane protein n=1 Tax=Thalictrum thalictroides TaxID=46969 RepID=A0A7J6VRN3_THATH|nr:transmembrane protein [Thalictrum thalictroides]
MDHIVFEHEDLIIDLETGGTTNDEGSNLLCRDWSGSVGFNNASIRTEDCVSSCNYGLSSPELVIDNGDLMIHKKESRGGETLSFFKKKMLKDKRKSTSSKKPPKPPRPPRGPSLDAADQKLIKEISELAMLRRARIEKIKAMKKMKAAKAASTNSNFYAMVITILFCLVIIVQGMLPGGSSQTSFSGSPESAVATSGGVISVHEYKNLSASNTDGPDSLSPNFIEQVSGSTLQEEGRTVAG